MPSYRTPTPEMEELLKEVMRKHHPDLVEVDVTVQIRVAHAKRDKNGIARGPALKAKGYPVAGQVSLFSVEDRVNGSPDVKLKIDGDRWDDWTAEQKDALLDHEIAHCVLIRDKEGQVELDEANRPRLKLRPHDAEIGILWDVVERHGKNAMESIAYLPIHQGMTQRVFQFG